MFDKQLHTIVTRLIDIYNTNILIKLGILVIAFMAIYLFRKLITKIFLYILKHVVKKTNNPSYEKLIQIIERPLRIGITTVLMYIAVVNILTLSPFANGILIKTVKSILAVSMFVTIYNIDDIVVGMFNKAYFKLIESENNILIPFLKNVYKVLIFIIGFIIVIQEWYDIGIIIAGLGVGGLAFALAAKETVANLFGSIVIIVEKIFNIGDYIETKRGIGVVEQVGFRSTTIRTFEDALVTIPNSIMSTEEIINWSKRGRRRVKFNLKVAYNTTIEQIKIVTNDIKEILTNDDGIENDSFFVNFTTFADSSFDIMIQYFTNTIDYAEYLATQEKINLGIIDIMNKNNTSFVYPSTSIYIEKNNA